MLRAFNKTYCYYAFAAVVAILFMVLYTQIPLNADDIWYSIGTYGVDNTLQATAIAFERCADHYLWDTGRLCNLISPIFLVLLPKMIFWCLTVAIILATFDLACRISQAPRGSLAAYFIVAAYVLCMPWHDNMMCIIYSLNYVWSSVLTLAVIYTFTTANAKHTALATATALVAGMMHEGFSLPSLAALATYAIINREVLHNRRSMFIAGAYCLGTALIFVSPSAWVRVGIESTAFERFGGLSIFKALLKYDYLYIIFSLQIVYTLVVKGKTFIADRPHVAKVAMLFVGAGAANVIMLCFYTGERMFWYADLLSMIGIAYMAKDFALTRGKKVAIISLAALTVTSPAVAIHEQCKIKRNYDSAVTQYVASADGNAFIDIASQHPTPLSAGKTTYYIFDDWMINIFNDYLGAKKLHIIPAALQHYRCDAADRVPSSRRYYLHDNYIIFDGDIAADSLITLNVKIDDGTWHKFQVITMPYTNAYAHRQTWLKPHNYDIVGYYYGDDATPKEVRHRPLPYVDEARIRDIER